MNEFLSFKNRIVFTVVLILLVLAWLIWDCYHGGVPVHHLLHRDDLPGFSNWWGALLLPVLSWFLLYRIQKRDKQQEKERNNKSTAFYGFIGALFTGIFFSILFSYGFENVLGYFMLVLLSIGLFLPTYRSEYVLGFVIGMTYTFGGILPTIIASILALAGLLMHEVIRPVGLFLGSRFLGLVNGRPNQR